MRWKLEINGDAYRVSLLLVFGNAVMEEKTDTAVFLEVIQGLLQTWKPGNPIP